MVMNHLGIEVAIGHGAPPDSLRSVGSPEYDKLAKGVRQGTLGIEPGEVRDRFALPHDRPVVTFGHQPLFLGAAVEEDIIRVLMKGARRAEANLLVKFHPRSLQEPDQWRKWADAEGYAPSEIGFANKECTSIEAIVAGDALVTPFSTLSLEAMIIGRPVVLINYLQTWVLLEYGKQYDAALEAQSPDDLADKVYIAVRDEQRRKSLMENARTVLDKELYGLDGKSVERIVSELITLAEARKRPNPTD